MNEDRKDNCNDADVCDVVFCIFVSDFSLQGCIAFDFVDYCVAFESTDSNRIGDTFSIKPTSTN